MQCRDPRAEDQNPSAGVADGSGDFERGAFHSFRDEEPNKLSLFDFMVITKQATDFSDARRQVAEASGVHFDRPESNNRMPTSALSPSSPTKVVRSALRGLRHRDALERAKGVDAIASATGLSKTVLREALRELLHEGRSVQPSESKRPEVAYVTNEDGVEELFCKIIEVLGPTERLFRNKTSLTWVEPGRGLEPLNTGTLPGLLSSQFEMCFYQQSPAGECDFIRRHVLPLELSRAFVVSPSVRQRLPELAAYTRTPVFDSSWNYVGVPGFHPRSGIFYDGPRLLPRSGTHHIEQLLGGFKWRGPEDMVNVIGILLTALTMPHWRDGHPLLVIDGNKSGVGKSFLASIIGAVVEGKPTEKVTYHRRDEEFEKALATRVEAGDRVILIDNIKMRVDSAVLERCVTDPVLSFRRLGSNTSISRANDVTFCLTMNMTQLSPDLRRRALPVSLVSDQDVEKLEFPIEDLGVWVHEHRNDVLRELAGMVQRWVEIGQPKCENPARHSTSQRWSATIDAILRTSGFHGFLDNFDAMNRKFDPKWETICAAAREGWRLGPATAGEWAKRLGDGAFFEVTRARNGQPRSPRGCSTAVGQLLLSYVGQEIPIGDNRMVRLVTSQLRGATHSKSYDWHLVERTP